MASEWPSEQLLRTRLATLIGSPPTTLSPFATEWQGTTRLIGSWGCHLIHLGST